MTDTEIGDLTATAYVGMADDTFGTIADIPFDT
jgi:hypothetical protein